MNNPANSERRMIEFDPKAEARRKCPKVDRYAMVLPLLRQRFPDACSELAFHPTRKWRFDFALPTQRIAIEIDGGAWTGGRHTRGSGFVKDCEKLNEAACLGWRVLRFTPSQINDGTLLSTVIRATERKP